MLTQSTQQQLRTCNEHALGCWHAFKSKVDKRCSSRPVRTGKCLQAQNHKSEAAHVANLKGDIQLALADSVEALFLFPAAPHLYISNVA